MPICWKFRGSPTRKPRGLVFVDDRELVLVPQLAPAPGPVELGLHRGGEGRRQERRVVQHAAVGLGPGREAARLTEAEGTGLVLGPWRHGKAGARLPGHELVLHEARALGEDEVLGGERGLGGDAGDEGGDPAVGSHGAVGDGADACRRGAAVGVGLNLHGVRGHGHDHREVRIALVDDALVGPDLDAVKGRRHRAWGGARVDADAVVVAEGVVVAGLHGELRAGHLRRHEPDVQHALERRIQLDAVVVRVRVGRRVPGPAAEGKLD